MILKKLTIKIKVITGIKRCGKSTLLDIFQSYLKENGIKEE